MEKPDQSKLPDDAETTGEGRLSRAQVREREQRRQLALARQRLLLMLIGAAVLINAVMGYVLYGTLVTQVKQERIEQLRAEHAQQRVQRVGTYLNDLSERLQRAVQTAERMGLEGLAPTLLGPYERQLASHFEQPLAVRLIPAGSAVMDRELAVPIRFAEMDLIRRAERREVTRPELVRVDERWHLHLIAPLPADAEQPLWGTLMVTLDNSGLSQAFAVGDTTMGQSQLFQYFEGVPPLLLQQVGSAGAVAEPLELPVANSYWRVRFTPSETLGRHAEEPPTLWILVLCASGLVSLLLAAVLSRVLMPNKPQSAIAPAAVVPHVPGEPRAEGEAELANPLYHNQDILDIAVIDEDEDILGLGDAEGKKPSTEPPAGKRNEGTQLPPGIFRAYDIRGIAGSEITPELAEHIGQAVGSEALDQGDASIIVGRDGRSHSPLLCDHLIKGIMRSGCQVIDIGVVPTPVLYFATHHLEETRSGVIVTASHNPAEYNGFKIVINGATLTNDGVLDIRARIQRQQYHRGQGGLEQRDLVPAYIERIFSDVALAGQVSLVIDAGNGVTGAVAPRLFEELGCEVTPLFCELDGHFPNHDPDPTREENLRDLIAKVQEVKADLGVAFDGDGDRLVVVTPSGKIIWPDQLLMLFARDILARHPGADVLFDVKCSRQLNQVITSYGGRPIMWKTGHSPMKSKMIETGALIGGEYSGHIFIKDRWYGFDDGMYAMARLLEIITLRDQGIDEVFASFPVLPATPELKIAVPDADKFALVDKLIAKGDFRPGKATTIDGLRVDFAKGWGLVRASNTSPALTLRFEAESAEALDKIQQLFKRELLKVNSALPIDF